MKKILALLTLLCACGFYAVSQTITLADPNDAIYTKMDAWATKGILKNLPRLRPYTEAMILSFLHAVVANGNPEDQASAQAYLDLLAKSNFNLRADVRADAVIGSTSNNLLAAAPGFQGNAMLTDSIGISARLNVWGNKGKTWYVNPYGSYYDRDFLYGSDSKTGSIETSEDIVSEGSIGDDSLAFQAGYMRGSWGPIYDDGVVVGPQSPSSGQMLFSWRTPGLTYDQGFYMLQGGWSEASGLSYLRDGTTGSGNTIGVTSDKFLMIHGLNWAPLPWMEVGIFESVVWLNRFEPMYILPVSQYFLSQSIGSFSDNSFAGLSSTFYLPESMKLDVVAYADDLDFSGMIKGKWDTKWKVAAEAALSWAPESPYLQRLSLDYTAVTPYTYTHEAYTGSDSSSTAYYGALAYTNGGFNIGPDLNPNSDRWTLKAVSKDIRGAKLTGTATFIRHGNASSDISGYSSVSGDSNGDLGDPGVWNDTNHDLIFYTLRFLTQSTLQLTTQLGADLSFSKHFEGIGTMDLGLGYTLEYIANSNLVAGATSVNHYFRFSAGFEL